MSVARRSSGALPRGALLAALLTAAAEARGADAAEDARARARAEADAPLPEGTAPRPLPDYGSAPSSTPSPWLEGALWIPRVALTPAYVTADLVARPLMAVGVFAEKHHLREHLHDFFTFGPEQRLALYPVAWLDLGFQPSVGAHFSWDGAGPAALSASVMTSGGERWQARARWSIPLGAPRLALRGHLSRSDDLIFHGLGGNSPARGARYAEQHAGIESALSVPVLSQLSLASWLGGHSSSFDARPDAGLDTLGRAIAAGLAPAPPALAGGLSVLDVGLRLELDNRTGRLSSAPRGAADFAHVSGTGVAARLQLSEHLGLQRTRARPADPARLPAWWGTSALLTGTLDLTGTQRRLDLELHAASVNPLRGAGDVPFSEQVSLGGARPLRGFPARRLVGRSAAAATLRYRWPIWSELDGTLHYGLGNVFGPYWRGIAARAARASFGLGIASASSSDHVFELLLAFGTEPLSRGGQVEHTRVAAGWNATF